MSTPIAVPRSGARPRCTYNVDEVRHDFPILAQAVHGKPLVYLDNAATAHKPRQVLETLRHFYETANSNVHRGVHFLSERATRQYEDARITVQRFLGARSPKEVLFVRGTTEGINLVAQSYGRLHVGAGDEIVISTMEHHSNIVPWQMLCQEKQARLRVIPIDEAGAFSLDDFEALLSERTRLVALVHVSNALGTINPVREVIERAHRRNIPVLLDAAQAVPHLRVDVQELDCDFLVFSGHKVYGPTGIGVLYGKADLLEEMPPYQGGGDMISSVTFEKTTYNVLPYKFEAGTPNIAGAVGLAAAVDYITALGLERIAEHEHDLLAYATRELAAVPTLRLIGTAPKKAAVVSFTLKGIHPHDIGTILDQEGIAVRTGHHCCQPVMDRYHVPATARASFGIYNTRQEVDALVHGLAQVREVFA